MALRWGPDTGRGQRFLLALGLLLLVAATLVAWPYRAAIVFALLIGYVLHPAYRWLVPRVRYRWLAASILLLAVAVAIVAPVVGVGWALFDEAQAAARAARDADGGVEALAVDALEAIGVPASLATAAVDRAASQAASALEGALGSIFAAVLEFVVSLVVFFVLLFFVFVDGDKLVAFLSDVIPLDPDRRTKLLERIGAQVQAILLGTLLVSVIQGVAAGLAWWFFGFPSPFFWGFVMTVLAVLPFAGPFLVIIPAGLFAIAQGNLFGGIGLLVVGIALVGIVDDVVRPYVIGRRSRVHPAVILIGIVGGVVVFGVSGLLLGPLLLALVAPVLEAWARPASDALAPGR